MIICNSQARSQDPGTFRMAFILAIFTGFLLSAGFAGLTFHSSKQILLIKLENQINPNFASASSLARLPGIGLTLADRIVNYRKNFVLTNQHRSAFEKVEDLKNISGIGPKKSQNVKELLKFK